jgi:HEPN domain-containing protein
MRRLAGDSGIEDDLVGFHGQQAVEKGLKEVLAARGIEFPLGHDLGLLLETASGARIDLPPDAEKLDGLTIYAVQARYSNPFGLGPLDREHVAEQVEAVGAWAECQLASPEE